MKKKKAKKQDQIEKTNLVFNGLALEIFLDICNAIEKFEEEQEMQAIKNEIGKIAKNLETPIFLTLRGGALKGAISDFWKDKTKPEILMPPPPWWEKIPAPVLILVAAVLIISIYRDPEVLPKTLDRVLGKKKPPSLGERLTDKFHQSLGFLIHHWYYVFFLVGLYLNRNKLMKGFIQSDIVQIVDKLVKDIMSPTQKFLMSSLNNANSSLQQSLNHATTRNDLHCDIQTVELKECINERAYYSNSLAAEHTANIINGERLETAGKAYQQLSQFSAQAIAQKAHQVALMKGILGNSPDPRVSTSIVQLDTMLEIAAPPPVNPHSTVPDFTAVQPEVIPKPESLGGLQKEDSMLIKMFKSLTKREKLTDPFAKFLSEDYHK